MPTTRRQAKGGVGLSAGKFFCRHSATESGQVLLQIGLQAFGIKGLSAHPLLRRGKGKRITRSVFAASLLNNDRRAQKNTLQVTAGIRCAQMPAFSIENGSCDGYPLTRQNTDQELCMYQELDQAWKQLTSSGQMFEVTTVEVRGIPLRAYAMAPPSLREFWLSTAGHGDSEYLVYRHERCTYRQAHAFTASIANWLSENGVKPGDRVAIAMRNYPEWMLAYWAITSMGAVVVGMNAWWVAREMHFGLEDA